MQYITGSAANGTGTIMLPPEMAQSVIQGTYAFSADADLQGGFRFENTVTHADGDGLRFKAYLTSGTYEVRILCKSDNHCPIMAIKLNGTKMDEVDLYTAAGSGTIDNKICISSGFTVGQAGMYTVDIVGDGKNIGADAYYQRLNEIKIVKLS